MNSNPLNITVVSSAALVAQQVVSKAGYEVLVDQKGSHRITSSTIKIIGTIINKELEQ